MLPTLLLTHGNNACRRKKTKNFNPSDADALAVFHASDVTCPLCPVPLLVLRLTHPC